MELVSVVVPTYNSARTIQACLESIRTQTYNDIELIVVDNASTDSTRAIADSYCDVLEERGPERSAQRNYGTRISHGSYLAFIDSDMLLEPSVIEDCVRIANVTGAAGVIIPEITKGEGFWVKCRALEKRCYTGDDLVEAPRFIPRDEFDTAGGFDEALVGGEDWDLGLRLPGRPFPRCPSQIIHDEGHLMLFSHLAKKMYYAESYRAYLRKHRRDALGRANVIVRPAFVRNWKQLGHHPVLTLGILSLKTLETGAALIGLFRSAGSRSEGRVSA